MEQPEQPEQPTLNQLIEVVITDPLEQQREVVTQLTQQLSLNDFGMPNYVYRGDYIPPTFQTLSQVEQQRYLDIARVPLYYHDGFPTTRSGSLFWEQLDFEGGGDFLLFHQFLDMSNDYGYRSINVLARALCRSKVNQRSKSEEHIGFSGTAKDAEAQNEAAYQATLSHLRDLHVFNYWALRATAFDLVGQAAVRKIRASRAILLEEKHYHALGDIVDQVLARFKRMDADDYDTMMPGEATKVLKELIQLQRVSVGLPAAAPQDKHLPGQQDSDASVTVEDHLRIIARTRNGAATTTNNALDDPETAELAQELIMRMIQKSRQ